MGQKTNEVPCKMVAAEVIVKEFEGILGHKNPECEKCGNHTYALYQGGKKERLADAFTCKRCNIIYKLLSKKCEFTEDNQK